jgi:iron complex outermembrane receptor protein
VSGDPEDLYSPNALIRAHVSNRQWGWLPRVRWEHAGGALTAGLEVRLHRSLHWGALRMGDGLPAGAVPDRRYYEYRGGKEIVSLHAQELAELTEQMRLLVGMQLVFNRYRLYDEKFLGTEFSIPYRFLNPKVGVNYNLSPSWHIYAQIAHTSREPRLKNLYDAAEASTPSSWGAVTPQFELLSDGSFDFTRPLVKPERLSSIELGVGFTGSRTRWTANAYLMNFRDEIVKNGKLDRFGQPITGNAEQTRHAGVELTANAHVTPWLTIDGNATLSRNRFVRFTSYEEGEVLVLDGNSIAGFPDFLANLRVTYITERFSMGLGLQHVGEFYTDNLQDPDDGRVLSARTVDARSILNFWLEYAVPADVFGAGAAFQLQMQNLLNRRYAMTGEADHFFPGATRNLFASVRVNM